MLYPALLHKVLSCYYPYYLSGYDVTKKLDLCQHMTHIACGYFFGSGIQNDVVSKDVGVLRNHGLHLRINHLVPV